MPANAGVGSAIGFLAAPVSFEIVKTKYMRLDGFDHADANALLAAVSAEIMAWVGPAARGQPVVETRVAFMRYAGQGHEIPVELPLRALTEADIASLHAQYELTYRRLFNRAIPQAAIEIMAWSVSCSTPAVLPPPIASVALDRDPARADIVQVFDGRREARIDVRRYRREALRPGTMIAGPALIVEPETTTYVTGSFDAWIDGAGSIVMDRKEIAA